MKKRWLFVTLLIGALAIGITGGTVLAQGSAATGGSPIKSFAARVAAILGVDEAKVQDAFKQAGKQMQDEAMQKKLNTMVAQGQITQAQADQMKQWYQSRPDVLSPGGPMGGGPMEGFGGRGFHRGHMFGGRRWDGMGPKGGVAPTPTPTSSGNTSF
ncbi:MAG: hypothetical protein EXR53_03840 [Dehalococcoidia bacterium]|nr:hypothetical protein [Dehalococcoidia bacterium]